MEQGLLQNTETLSDDYFVEKYGVDNQAEYGVVCLLRDMFSPVAYMDVDMLRRNLNMGCKGKTSDYDRSISMELADDLLRKFGLIFTGLIVNVEFRDAVMEAVSVEIALESRNEEFVREIRQRMGEDTYGSIDHDHSYVIDLSSYNDEVFKEIAGALVRAFDVILPYEEEIDIFEAGLSEDDRIAIGYIASNFMYLIRAFAHNQLFTKYVLCVCETVASDLPELDWG